MAPSERERLEKELAEAYIKKASSAKAASAKSTNKQAGGTAGRDGGKSEKGVKKGGKISENANEGKADGKGSSKKAEVKAGKRVASPKKPRKVSIPCVSVIFQIHPILTWHHLCCDCSWQKKHEYTDLLLRRIKESPRLRQALGFHTDTQVSSGGKKTTEVYEELGKYCFIDNNVDLGFTLVDVPKLGTSVKNRLNSNSGCVCIAVYIVLLFSLVVRLKKTFAKWKSELSATGHGLVEADREDEITPGTEIANAWRELFILFWMCS